MNNLNLIPRPRDNKRINKMRIDTQALIFHNKTPSYNPPFYPQIIKP